MNDNENIYITKVKNAANERHSSYYNVLYLNDAIVSML